MAAMTKKLCFACHFPDGSAVRMRADLRELCRLPKGGLLVPRFEYHHGKLPPANELQDWAVQALSDLARRVRREFTAQTPVGIMWRFAPDKKPQKGHHPRVCDFQGAAHQRGRLAEFHVYQREQRRLGS